MKRAHMCRQPSDGNTQSSEHSVVVLRVVDDWLASDGGKAAAFNKLAAGE